DSEAAKKELKRQESYWLKTFEKEPQMINLPVDFERPANKSYEGGVLGITVERSEAAALNAFALKENTTLFVVVLSMYNIFLSKICRQSDIVVGIPTSGRNFPGLASMLGMFINSMALRNYPEGQKTFKEFVQQVKTRTLDSFENPDYPFEDLVAKVVKTRDAARNPVFDVFFSFTYPHVETAESEELPAAVDFPLKLGPYARDIEKHRLLSMFDLYLHGLKLKDDISLGLTYCSSLFKKETIERFAGYFKDILSAVMENNEIKIEDIKISHDLGIAQTNVFQDEDDEFDF
ncbi:MAG: hypothetical protein GY940_38720, partial [bacterium]|nr:hypothetical protein [bacterium]